MDDNASARDIFQGMLQSLHIDAVCVTDGLQALDALEQAQTAGKPFGLVLVDWHMPVINGVETIRRIQANQNLANTPMCMMVTAHSREELLRRVQESGVNIDGLLIKPVAPSTLHDSIMTALGMDAVPRRHKGSSRGARTDVEAALRGAHILLVEDNDMNREFALEILGRAGIQVDVAANGKEALERIDCFHYDCVLMDCQMPVMDGFQATRLIRSDARFAALPVVAMTANAMAGDKEKCASAGMNDHIAKPIDIDLMFLTLARWVKPRVGADLTFAMPAALPPTMPIRGVAELDVATVMARIGDDGNLFRNMLGWFLDGNASYVANMRAAIAIRNRPTAHRLAHTLKGAAGDIGATRLCDAAKRLELALLAPTESVPPALLDEVETLLVQQLADIARALQPPAGALPIACGQPTGEAALAALLREMAKLLANDDAQALELTAPLAALAQTNAEAAGFRRLEGLIEDYSLNEALTLLRGIAARIDIKLD